MAPNTLLPFLSLFLLATLFTACEAAPADIEADHDDPITSACYHFELSGQLEYSATCRDYHLTPNPDGGLIITLLAPPLALFLEIPETLALGQYPLQSRQAAAENDSIIGTEILYNPLDGPEEHFNSQLEGTITIIRFDESGISALFRFQAEPRSASTPGGIAVQGHLRDLAIQRN